MKSTKQIARQKHYVTNKESTKVSRVSWYKEKKAQVIAYYGGECDMCAINDPEVLTVDHLYNDGAAHRKVVPASGVYHWLIKNRFPPGFRILCFNCNHKARLVSNVKSYPAFTIRSLQKEIASWASSVFPDRNAESILKKFQEELDEWLESPDDPSEFADLIILILDFATIKGIDIHTAVREKLGINYARAWFIGLDGVAHHVET